MRHRIFIYTAFFLYILFMTALMIYLGIGIALDRYAFLLLFFALLIGRFKGFIIDWFPFLFIWLSYDFLRGFADNLNTRVHFESLIIWERALFNSIPTKELQKLFFNPNHLGILDYFTTVIYFLHFALAETFAFFLWLKDRHKFKQFVTAILILSYAGWVSYIIYPSAPPWMASEKSYTPHLTKIIDQTLKSFPEQLKLPTIYHNFNPNPVAAFPSMHAAYPFLVLLFLISMYKKKALWFLPFLFSVYFSLVYLGEHYIVDILGGIVYAIIFYVLAKWLHHNVKLPTWQKKT